VSEKWEDALRAAEAEAARLQEEALSLGVRRVFRRELAAAERAAFLRGRLWGQRDMVRRLRAEHFGGVEDADAHTPIPGLDGEAGA
jgi:hypothetical protein